MKVWRNSEGREFPVHEKADGERGWCLLGDGISPDNMRLLGYELVDAEPEDTEASTWTLIGRPPGAQIS